MSALIENNTINPSQEVLFYEALWFEAKGVRFQDLSELLQKRLPSDVSSHIPEAQLQKIKNFLKYIDVKKYDVLIRETADYPKKLEALDIPLLYYRGDISLINSPCVSIVGSRKSSARGINSAKIIANSLANDGYTIVSGLAAGIDTAAHMETLRIKKKTIAVIGTPINKIYPKENRILQEKIATTNLLLSHVPFFKYSQQHYRVNSRFFPERNKVMAALSSATIIAEASDTSGSLIQAREALRIGKKVIILKPSYDNPNLTWPKTYVHNKGAFVAETVKDIKDILGD